MIHVIEGWWDGVRGDSATDAAAAACAAAMRSEPEHAAIVLGPRSAADRAEALGVRSPAWVCPPVGSPRLARRSLAAMVQELAGGGGMPATTAWTPGAAEALSGLDVSMTDHSPGSSWRWLGKEERSGVPKAEIRASFFRDAGRMDEGEVVLGLLADPPGSFELLMTMYGVGIAEKAGSFGGRRVVVVAPRGVRGADRAAAMLEGVGHEISLIEREEPMGVSLAGLDGAILAPLEGGAEGREHLRHARQWWCWSALAAGVRVIAGPEELWPEIPEGLVRIASWKRADLARAMGRLVEGVAP